MSRRILEQGREEVAAELAQYPRIGVGEPFGFVCAGCGECCRQRRDLLLSGFDLYRLARRLSLPPRLLADAFCKEGTGPETCLPTLRLKPNRRTGNCPFFDGGCTVHPARPLACALYPLGQAIDPATAQIEYYVQPPLCGAVAENRTLQNYLEDAAITARVGTDARWAVVCSGLSATLRAAGGTANPHCKAAQHRILRALYYDYTIRDEFYPQFAANVERLLPLLDRLLCG